jgi:hypothetical protein
MAGARAAVCRIRDLPPGIRTFDYVRDWLLIRREQCAKREYGPDDRRAGHDNWVRFLEIQHRVPPQPTDFWKRTSQYLSERASSKMTDKDLPPAARVGGGQ